VNPDMRVELFNQLRAIIREELARQQGVAA
jgi:hypothetical protein